MAAARRRRSKTARPLEVPAVAVILGAAAVLLFWNLDARYLWQDEAHTAVLSVRMLETGKPLAYDGINLLTGDHFVAEDAATIGARAADPRAALDYYIARGDMKTDTAWILQPWGQFVVAAAGIGLLGETTLAARLPFALAGLATVALLYGLVRRTSGSAWMAALAASLLTLNAYWVLHNRQCRYYALSGLLLLLTLVAYLRWQRGDRGGAAAFVVSAWCWFQVDYGTVWPVLAVLFADAGRAALLGDRRRGWEPVRVGAILAAAVAPFAWYYELWGRKSVQIPRWMDRFGDTAFLLNQYLVPIAVLAGAAALLAWRWRQTPEAERRLVGISCATLGAMLLWVPTVAPGAFLRYLVPVAPLACLTVAWLLVRAAGAHARGVSLLAAAVLALTPWLAEPLNALLPTPPWSERHVAFRRELVLAASDIFGQRPDPNRRVVEWLREHAEPGDEILVNYEDVPLIFYLDNPIRGGIAAFRVEDRFGPSPRFAVIRRSVPFVHWPVFRRELQRHRWQRVELEAPDVRWGNNPDPSAHFLLPDSPADLFIARRRDG